MWLPVTFRIKTNTSSYLILRGPPPQPVQHVVRLVPGGEGGEEVLFALGGVDLDGVGDHQRRLLLGEGGHLAPGHRQRGLVGEYLGMEAEVVEGGVHAAVDEDVLLEGAGVFHNLRKQKLLTKPGKGTLLLGSLPASPP